MKDKIYYFSATGNSLWVARQLSKRLNDAEIVRVCDSGETIIDVTIDKIGIVFPVIMFGLPVIIEKFIKSIRASEDHYFFAVATCGGMECNTLIDARNCFMQAGIRLSSGFSVKMVNNCTSLSPPVPEDQQQKRFTLALEKIDFITDKIREKRSCFDKGIPVLNWYFSGILHKKAKGLIAEAARYFYVNHNCDGCGICQKVCPVENIALNQNKPLWGTNCQQCYACLQWCPKESIQVLNKKTEGRKRYHHPEIQLREILK